MKVWAKRHRDLSSHRTRIACRLHAVLCELSPGGFAGEISAAQATRLLDELEPAGAVGRSPTRRRRPSWSPTCAASTTSCATPSSGSPPPSRRRKTTLTELFGVGPIVAATIIGDVGDIGRFPSRDRLRRLQRHRPDRGVLRRAATQGVPAVTARQPSTQPRHPHGRRHPDPPPPQPRPRLLRPQDRRRPQRQRSDPGAQAADQRRRLHASSATTPTGPAD